MSQSVFTRNNYGFYYSKTFLILISIQFLNINGQYIKSKYAPFLPRNLSFFHSNKMDPKSFIFKPTINVVSEDGQLPETIPLIESEKWKMSLRNKIAGMASTVGSWIRSSLSLLSTDKNSIFPYKVEAYFPEEGFSNIKTSLYSCYKAKGKFCYLDRKCYVNLNLGTQQLSQAQAACTLYNSRAIVFVPPTGATFNNFYEPCIGPTSYNELKTSAWLGTRPTTGNLCDIVEIDFTAKEATLIKESQNCERGTNNNFYLVYCEIPSK